MGHLIARWLLAVMIAGGQMGNALTGGNPQESLSSRAGRARDRGPKIGAGACHVFEAFDFHKKERLDHCTLAIERHRLRLEENLATSQEGK